MCRAGRREGHLHTTVRWRAGVFPGKPGGCSPLLGCARPARPCRTRTRGRNRIGRGGGRVWLGAGGPISYAPSGSSTLTGLDFSRHCVVFDGLHSRSTRTDNYTALGPAISGGAHSRLGGVAGLLLLASVAAVKRPPLVQGRFHARISRAS